MGLIRFLFPGWPIANGRFYAVIFLCMLVALPFIFFSTKRNKIDRWIGELSYPVYVAHFFIIKLLRPRIDDTLHLAIAVIVITIIFSVAGNFLLTGSIEKFRQRRKLVAQ